MTKRDGYKVMDEKAISEQLVRQGQKLRDSDTVEFFRSIGLPWGTDVPEADKLNRDLQQYPHAFVLACIMDQQQDATKSWLIAYQISQKIGGFSMEQLSSLSEQEILQWFLGPPSLHRFTTRMGRFFYAGIQKIKTDYGGDASRIWNGSPYPSCALVVRRFDEFAGVGPKIAHMAANILDREFKIPLPDRSCIDISSDVHIRRVFTRLGLCGVDSKSEEIINQEIIRKARTFHPEYPGLMDLPCWEIGKKWCRPKDPSCGECFMRNLCPTAGGIRVSG